MKKKKISKKSIKKRLISIINIISIFLGIFLMFFSYTFLKNTIDNSQYIIYKEKIDILIKDIEYNYKKLKNTLNIDEYEKNFKENVLVDLSEKYYKDLDVKIYPFIIDYDGNVIMHPDPKVSNTNVSDFNFIDEIIENKIGDIYYNFESKEKWAIFRDFKEWQWIIGYSVEWNKKYSVLYRFFRIYTLVLITILIIINIVIRKYMEKYLGSIEILTKKINFLARGNLEDEINIDTDIYEIYSISRNVDDMRISIQYKIKELIEEMESKKRISEELIEKNSILDVVFEESPIGIVIYDLERIIKFVNGGFINITGKSQDYYLNKNVYDILYKKQLKEHKDIELKCLSNRSRSYSYISNPILDNGKDLYLNNVIKLLLKNEKAYLFVVIIQDITELINKNNELYKSETKFRVLFEKSPIPIEIYNKEGFFIGANKRWEELWGVSQEIITNKYNVLKNPYFQGKKVMENIKKAFNGEYVFMDKFELDPGKFGYKSNPKILRTYIYPIKNQQDDIENVIFTYEDVTERVKNQKMIIQNEKMMSVGGLAAGMAHEINNPLSGIVQGIQNIKRRFSPDLSNNIKEADKLGLDINKIIKYLEKRKIINFIDGVDSSAKRAADIVRNMLEFSRASKGEKEFFDIKDIIDKSIELCRNDYNLNEKYDFKKIKILKEYPEKDLCVKVIKNEIEQVFFNILKNAAFALNIKKDQDPYIRISIVDKADKIDIKVFNNGPKISNDKISSIFDPFFSTKPSGEGTGLGLSVSYFIICDNHGGEISVRNKESGVEFNISLKKNLLN